MIVVAGGTGRLGRLVVARALRRGRDVRVLTRDPARARGLDRRVQIAVGDVRDPGTLAAAVSGADVVVSAVHGFAGPGRVSPRSVDRDGNRNIVDAAERVGADLVLVSVVGAAADSPLELFRCKHAAERYAQAGEVPTTVVRADAFLEQWTDILRRTAGRSGRAVVLGRGTTPMRFVPVEEVAEVVDRVVADPRTRGRVVEVPGAPRTLDELARSVTGDRAPRHVPPGVLRAAAATVGRLHRPTGRILRTALVMDAGWSRHAPAPPAVL